MHQDLAECFQMRSTDGWRTLLVILQSTGERNPKRPRSEGEHGISASRGSGAAASPSRYQKPTDTDEPLAKRFAAVRLNEDRPSRHSAQAPGS
jgi:nuclear protein localization protein 4 homolog